MEDKRIISREYSSITRSDLMDDGYWKVTSTTTDKLLREGDDWVVETIEAEAVDADVQEAIKMAMNSTLQYIIQNVYHNGFSSLVEFKEYERSLKKGSTGEFQA